MTWEKAMKKIEKTILKLNDEINELRNENIELKKNADDSKAFNFQKIYNQVTHNTVRINSNGDIMLYDDSVKLCSFYTLKNREFIQFMPEDIFEKFVRIEEQESYGELMKFKIEVEESKNCTSIPSTDIYENIIKGFKEKNQALKDDLKDYEELEDKLKELQFQLNERKEKFDILAKQFNEVVKENSLCKEQNKELYDTLDTIRKICKKWRKEEISTIDFTTKIVELFNLGELK